MFLNKDIRIQFLFWKQFFDGDQIPLQDFMSQLGTCRGFIGYFCECSSEQKSSREVRQKKKLNAEGV